MVDNSKKAVKAGVGYTIGNVLIKGIGFLSIPIFSRLMTTEEFGVYNVFISYEAFLYVIVGMAIHTSVRSANLEFRGKIDNYVSSVTIIYFVNFCILGLLLLIFKEPISGFLGFDVPIVVLLLIYSLGSALLTLYNEKIALDYAYKNFLEIAFFNAIGNVVISFIAIFTVLSDHRDYGRIIGASITLGITTIYVLFNLYRRSKPVLVRSYWKFAFSYSLPIVPHGISQVLLAQVDRIMIRYIVGYSEAGIYSLAANIQLILSIIIDSVIKSWSTWFYENIYDGNTELIKRKAIELCGLFSVFAIGLISLTPELITVLGGKTYELGKYVAIPLIVSSFIIFMYDIVVLGEYYTKKTKYIMMMTMLAAFLNVVTNYIFIKRYGFIAAAYTTLFSYFVYLFLHTVIAKKLLGFHIIPLKWMFGYMLFVCISAALNLVFIDYIIIRWGLCVLEVLPLIIWLIKRNKEIFDKIIKRR